MLVNQPYHISSINFRQILFLVINFNEIFLPQIPFTCKYLHPKFLLFHVGLSVSSFFHSYFIVCIIIVQKKLFQRNHLSSVILGTWHRYFIPVISYTFNPKHIFCCSFTVNFFVTSVQKLFHLNEKYSVEYIVT